MRLKLGIAASMIAVFVSGSAFGQEAIIKLRKQIMASNGAAAEVLVGMVRGQIPYDAALAAAAVSTIGHDNSVFPSFFPDGTQTGAETKAKPAIWENMDDFKAISQDIAGKAEAAAAAAANGKDAFTQAFLPVGQACNTCHEKYRVE